MRAMKKAFAFISLLAAAAALALLCGCGGAAQSGPAAPGQTYEDAELARAVELGLGPYKETDEAVTWGEFTGMLDEVAALAGCEAAPGEGALKNARRSRQSMTRREGMVALYFAAEAMGPEYWQYNNAAGGTWIFEEIADADPQRFWDEMWDCDYRLLPDVEAMPLNGEGYYVNAGYLYAMKRASVQNGEPLFEYDSQNKTMRPADPFAYTEALRAAVRLYDSYCGPQARPETEADQEILAKADARRREILNSPTGAAAAGASYYVAANGSDSNDGRSEATPWASLEKVNSAPLQPGDAVYFRRGDVWRGGALIAQPGVTYSAYGEGAKPGIYGSPENGADPQKWSLLAGTDNVWVFYKPMMDCGDLVLDGSMEKADKAPVWWAGSGYVKDEPRDTFEELRAKPAFDPARDLENLQYFNEIDYSGLGEGYPLYVYSHADREGALYLRCDAGNPGEVYDSIEFCCDPYNGCVVTLEFGPGAVLDNLAILYGGHAVEANGGRAVQNCEVGYMGAMTHTFYEEETNYSGDGISHTLNMTVENNYVHHVFNGGIAAGEMAFAADEAFADTEEIQGNNLIRGNLLEYTAGITLLNWEEEANPLHRFKDVVIEDNMVLYACTAGDAAGTKAADITGALVFTGRDEPTPCVNEGLVIRNNVFYCSRDALIISAMPEEYYPVYQGNTYAQYPSAPFAHWRFEDGTFRTVFAGGESGTERFVREQLGDETGTVLQ